MSDVLRRQVADCTVGAISDTGRRRVLLLARQVRRDVSWMQ